MCFSAQMSFIVAAALTGVAALSYRSLKKLEQLPLATIPALFALQQYAEGILWVLLPTQSHPWLITLAKYTFLSVAFVIWPLFIPLSILALEKDTLRRYLITGCSVIGLAWSFVTSWYLGTYGATVSAESCHLYYQLGGLLTEDYIQIGLYVGATIVPLLLSSNRALQIMGGIVAASFVGAYLFYYTYFISVWCFFAAIISLSVLYILRYHLD